MQYVDTREAIALIWEQLARPWAVASKRLQKSVVETIVADGWACRHDIEDLLWEADDRADTAFRGGALDGLATAFRLIWRSRYRHPRARDATVYGARCMPAQDVAAYAIAIENLGFRSEPSKIVDRLLPSVKAAKWLDDSELSILWYARNRQKMPPIGVRVADATAERFQIRQLETGYTAIALFDAEGPTALRVTPPHYREGIKLADWAEIAVRRPEIV